MKRIFVSFFYIVFYLPICCAQFSGGPGKGFTRFISSINLGNNIFKGGADDGVAHIAASTNLGINIFKGGADDGVAHIAASTNLGINIFKGGADDGVAHIAASTNLGVNIFSGGSGDGFSKAVNTSALGTNIYAGGSGDGWIKVASSISLPVTWVGTTSNDWNTASNWSVNRVPSASDNEIIIPTGAANMPVLVTSLQSANNLNIQSAASVNITGSIQVSGTLTNNGIINGGGTIVLNGTVNQTIAGIGTISNLTLNNSNGGSISAAASMVNLTGAINILSGILTTNDNLTLKSSAVSTARVAPMISGSISGNVTVERYIPANTSRAWRLLSIPTVTSQTINASWQNGQSSAVAGTTGVGTMITSNNGNASFDFQTPGNSMLQYNVAADSWSGISSTTLPISTDNGYMLFIRGDRTALPSNTLKTATVLSTTGFLKQGAYPSSPISITANKFGLIGNPYASQIDFRSVTKSAGIDNIFYVWDSKLTGSYGLGAYQTLTYNGSNYIITPGGGSYGVSGSIMNTIESGQAFFVHATSSGNISFTENAKSTGSNNVFRTSSTPYESLITNLYSVEASGDDLADGNMVIFDNSYSNSVDRNDALKLTNFGVNFGIEKENNILSVEKRRTIEQNDTIYFNLSNVKQQEYRFEFIANALTQPGLSAYLIDKYLNTSAPIDLNGTTVISFSVNEDSASAAKTRFNIVFTKSLITSVTALKGIVVYPNPIENGSLKLQFNNMAKGIYTARLLNSAGQIILVKQINHAAGSSTEIIGVNNIKGAFILEITMPENTKSVNKIIIK